MTGTCNSTIMVRPPSPFAGEVRRCQRGAGHPVGQLSNDTLTWATAAHYYARDGARSQWT